MVGSAGSRRNGKVHFEHRASWSKAGVAFIASPPYVRMTAKGTLSTVPGSGR